MKRKADISLFIQNFDDEVENKVDWLNVHINLLFIEINQIQDTIYIFETVESEWNRRFDAGEKINYSTIRTTLYEALPYRVVMGLSRIFIGEKEFSLLKTINVLSQLDVYKNSSEVKAVLNEVREYLSNTDTVKIITTFRDQLFAHLDKTSVLSDGRIDPTTIMKYISKEEINKGKNLIGKLHHVCFNQILMYSHAKLSEEDIIYTFFGS
ncbi:MAG: hypothetical protein RR048_04855 [Oscillospiraceae bacterium]